MHVEMHHDPQFLWNRYNCVDSNAQIYEHGTRKLSRFRFLKSLGQGSYGKVGLYYDKDRKMEVAIKRIAMVTLTSGPSGSSKRGNDRKRFDREIVYLRELNDHPNIIRLLEVFETREALWMVMEYVDSGELFNYIVKKRFLSMDESFCYLRQIISALMACHYKSGIVHRDLKPENILLQTSKNGSEKLKRFHNGKRHKSYFRIVLGDFGFSNRVSGSPCRPFSLALGTDCQTTAFSRPTDASLMTTFCGSPYYASPEMIQGKPYQGPAVDIWSLGIILYAMSFGRLPFDGSSTTRLFDKILRGPLNFPTEEIIEYSISKKEWSRCSVEALVKLGAKRNEYSLLEDLLRKMLTKDASQRISLLSIIQHPWYVMMSERESDGGNVSQDVRRQSCSAFSFQSQDSQASGTSLASRFPRISLESLSLSGILKKCRDILFKKVPYRKHSEKSCIL